MGSHWNAYEDTRGCVCGGVTLLFLPPPAPQLMPAERVWLWMKQRRLSNRVFKDEAEIVEACIRSWRSVDPERIETVAAEAWVAGSGELPASAGVGQA